MDKNTIVGILFAMLWGFKIVMDNNGKKKNRKTVKYILAHIAIATLFLIVAGYVWQANLL